ncbi:hypothetical protein [Deinococcus hopiensis]|uniref:Uncharacterized protein n=1 Tax=Deinococcus hopiensis KR-140 TaxID=695939 RepID=A0A1W1URR1_9DEIO|nr:hypothetical protein [Deinococcus hopiensis]SMB83777.1 hypothetical protein SAMN00790413_04887 [Deinococcus hopiensis KR-140]
MKNMLFLPLIALTLAGCTAGQDVSGPSTAHVPTNLSAQALDNSVYCPPDYRWCGNYLLSQRPGMGGDIIPADWTITGSKDLGGLLGQTLQGRFPKGDNAKFSVGKVLFTVGQWDPAFYGKAFSFSLQWVKDQGNGQYTYGYVGQAVP